MPAMSRAVGASSMIISNPRVLVLILMHFYSVSYLVIPTLPNNLASEPST